MERNRMELLPGVFLTLVRRREDEPACFRTSPPAFARRCCGSSAARRPR